MAYKGLAFLSGYIMETQCRRENTIHEDNAFQSACRRRHTRLQIWLFGKEFLPVGHMNAVAPDHARHAFPGWFAEFTPRKLRQAASLGVVAHHLGERVFRILLDTAYEAQYIFSLESGLRHDLRDFRLTQSQGPRLVKNGNGARVNDFKN